MAPATHLPAESPWTAPVACHPSPATARPGAPPQGLGGEKQDTLPRLLGPPREKRFGRYLYSRRGTRSRSRSMEQFAISVEDPGAGGSRIPADEDPAFPSEQGAGRPPAICWLDYCKPKQASHLVVGLHGAGAAFVLNCCCGKAGPARPCCHSVGNLSPSSWGAPAAAVGGGCGRLMVSPRGSRHGQADRDYANPAWRVRSGQRHGVVHRYWLGPSYCALLVLHLLPLLPVHSSCWSSCWSCRCRSCRHPRSEDTYLSRCHVLISCLRLGHRRASAKSSATAER